MTKMGIFLKEAVKKDPKIANLIFENGVIDKNLLFTKLNSRMLGSNVLEEGIMDTLSKWTNAIMRKIDGLGKGDEEQPEKIILTFKDENDKILSGFTEAESPNTLYLLIPAHNNKHVNYIMSNKLTAQDMQTIRPVNMSPNGSIKQSIRFSDYKTALKDSGFPIGIIISLDRKAYKKYSTYEMDPIFKKLAAPKGFATLDKRELKRFTSFFDNSRKDLIGSLDTRTNSLIGVIDVTKSTKFDASSILYPALLTKDDAEDIANIVSNGGDEQDIQDVLQNKVADHSPVSQKIVDLEQPAQTPQKKQAQTSTDQEDTQEEPAKKKTPQEKVKNLAGDILRNLMQGEIFDAMNERNPKYANLVELLTKQDKTEQEKEKIADVVSEIDKLLSGVTLK